MGACGSGEGEGPAMAWTDDGNCELNCVPQEDMPKSQSPAPVNMTLFENSVSEDIMTFR